MCVCVCVRACKRACVWACVCICESVCGFRFYVFVCSNGIVYEAKSMTDNRTVFAIVFIDLNQTKISLKYIHKKITSSDILLISQ